MFLFIFESIGTSELLLIGVVALMFLGPRRMPEMARKLGKIMSEFRGTANEFKETWQREVDFEEEVKAFDMKSLEDEPIARADPSVANRERAARESELPSIRAVDPERLEELKSKVAESGTSEPGPQPPIADDPNDKQNWL